MLRQVGVRETSGRNDGPMVREYLASTGLPEGHPWCAAIVHWCYRKCGDVKEPIHLYARAAQWHTEEFVIWRQGDPHPEGRLSRDGDHFSLHYASLGRIGHTGLIYGEDDNHLRTVEGNTNAEGSREGNQVALRRRTKRTIHTISRHP